ncbi:MAG: NAD(P)-dependent oxidoreductase [Methanobacteriota archaeon]|nr:MAG: NAD(P)-dependent oxidoreductase [Euryarchaeota archaeon]
MAGAWCENIGMELCWGRVFFPYGLGESKSRLIPYLVRSFRKGDVPVCRNSGAFRDLIHVEDVARGFLVLLKKGCKGAYNISSGVPVRICEVVQEIAKLFGMDKLDLSETYVAEGEHPLLVGENSRLMVLGWKPAITLSEGLETYIEKEL